MTKRSFTSNIDGRVRKIRTKDPLIPLFEAISNSLDSIEARHKIDGDAFKGKLDIEIQRNSRQMDLSGSEVGIVPITGFTITDNGIGFNAEHMDAFCDADSTFKASIGGKGVGRFSWLKFFEHALVESVFADADVRKKRKFVFSAKDGADEEKIVEVSTEIGTTVTLAPLRSSYEPKMRVTLEDVSIAVIEHFIALFATTAVTNLVIRDGAAAQDVCDLFDRSIATSIQTRTVRIKEHEFSITALRFFLGDRDLAHTGFLCGHRRAAERIVLAKRDPFLSQRFSDDTLRKFALQLFVQGDYLDALVNDERDGVGLPEAGSIAAREGVTKDEIADEVISYAHEILATEISKIKDTNTRTVASFVSQDAPQYRYVVAKHKDAIAAIHDTDKAKIDQALRRIQFEEESTTRREVSAILRESDESGAGTSNALKQKYDDILGRLSEEGKANLAAYIVHRKYIIELLRKRTEVSHGAYSLEEAMHKLIFPMRTTSDDVSYEQQNLWIIDERLSYHYYLASDKPLASMPPAESNSRREPDIIVFNRPIALNDKPEGERFESIAIIEFKRPGESSVDGQKHPVQQVQEYIELIMSGRALNRKGQRIESTSATYFFGYVVCHLDPLLITTLKRLNMKLTPDGRGMFGFFDEHKAYIEVVSYEKMLDDAQKRNRILFDKLKLPTQSG